MPSCVLWDHTQVLTQDLAHVRLRQGVEKAHLLRHLVGRKLPATVCDRVLFSERCAWRLRHEQPHRLTRLLVLEKLPLNVCLSAYFSRYRASLPSLARRSCTAIIACRISQIGTSTVGT